MEKPLAKRLSRLCKAPRPQKPPLQEQVSGPASFGSLRAVVVKGNVADGLIHGKVPLIELLDALSAAHPSIFKRIVPTRHCRNRQWGEKEIAEKMVEVVQKVRKEVEKVEEKVRARTRMKMGRKTKMALRSRRRMVSIVSHRL